MGRLDLIQYRRGTSAMWLDVNPILSSGEVGYDTTNNAIRIGNGERRWSDLLPIGVSEEAIEEAVNDYLQANPPQGVSPAYVQDALLAHKQENDPHDAYDIDIPSLSILFQNGLA